MAGLGMIDRGKRSVLGVGVSVIDYGSAVDRIVAAAQARRPLAVSALAVHGVMTGALDPEHRYRLNSFDLITADGQPVRWALRWLHREPMPDRVYGPQLTLQVCERAAELGLSIFLYGSRPDVLDTLQARLTSAVPGLLIAGAEPSKFKRISETEAAEVDARVIASGADIVLVGLGCPRQEVFVYEHVGRVSRPMLAVGAAFDFHAGLLRQAPVWMQDRGLEWLFRLWVEPGRLWRRYLLLNPLYCLMTAGQLLGLGHNRPPSEHAPTAPLGFA